MIITIDGPAGSGKSTVARKLAVRLGISYLDTGAMYRAVALAALERGIDPSDERAVVGLAERIELTLDCEPTKTLVCVDGHDVSEAIRTMAVSGATSQVSKHPGVRRVLIEQQRRIGRGLGTFVTEGRDQGAAVFPEANHKFVLEASLRVRADRRLKELSDRNESVSIQAVMDDLGLRDENDARRWQPLLDSGGAKVVDTTDLTLEQVVDRIAGFLPGDGVR